MTSSIDSYIDREVWFDGDRGGQFHDPSLSQLAGEKYDGQHTTLQSKEVVVVEDEWAYFNRCVHTVASEPTSDNICDYARSNGHSAFTAVSCYLYQAITPSSIVLEYLGSLLEKPRDQGQTYTILQFMLDKKEEAKEEGELALKIKKVLLLYLSVMLQVDTIKNGKIFVNPTEISETPVIRTHKGVIDRAFFEASHYRNYYVLEHFNDQYYLDLIDHKTVRDTVRSIIGQDNIEVLGYLLTRELFYNRIERAFGAEDNPKYVYDVILYEAVQCGSSKILQTQFRDGFSFISDSSLYKALELAVEFDQPHSIFALLTVPVVKRLAEVSEVRDMQLPLDGGIVFKKALLLAAQKGAKKVIEYLMKYYITQFDEFIICRAIVELVQGDHFQCVEVFLNEPILSKIRPTLQKEFGVLVGQLAERGQEKFLKIFLRDSFLSYMNDKQYEAALKVAKNASIKELLKRKKPDGKVKISDSKQQEPNKQYVTASDMMRRIIIGSIRG